jgi:hypothetical protein
VIQDGTVQVNDTNSLFLFYNDYPEREAKKWIKKQGVQSAAYVVLLSTSAVGKMLTC